MWGNAAVFPHMVLASWGCPRGSCGCLPEAALASPFQPRALLVVCLGAGTMWGNAAVFPHMVRCPVPGPGGEAAWRPASPHDHKTQVCDREPLGRPGAPPEAPGAVPDGPGAALTGKAG
eukprot:3920205-Pyramimonas_sp.AAC.1